MPALTELADAIARRPRSPGWPEGSAWTRTRRRRSPRPSRSSDAGDGDSTSDDSASTPPTEHVFIPSFALQRRPCPRSGLRHIPIRMVAKRTRGRSARRADDQLAIQDGHPSTGDSRDPAPTRSVPHRGRPPDAVHISRRPRTPNRLPAVVSSVTGPRSAGPSRSCGATRLPARFRRGGSRPRSKAGVPDPVAIGRRRPILLAVPPRPALRPALFPITPTFPSSAARIDPAAEQMAHRVLPTHRTASLGGSADDPAVVF